MRARKAIIAPEALSFSAPPWPEIRAPERVRELAEVFTNEREINSMLDLVADDASDIDSRFLEPSCGSGNFLVAILKRKLETIALEGKRQKDCEFDSLRALASIYGIDISLRNINDARKQMKATMEWFYSSRLNTYKPRKGYKPAIDYIVRKNVVKGDMLNGVEKIKFTEFDHSKSHKFRQRIFRLPDLIEAYRFDGMRPRPIEEIPMKNYWELSGK